MLPNSEYDISCLRTRRIQRSLRRDIAVTEQHHRRTPSPTMQRCLKLLALARCSGFLLPRAARITPPKLRESAGDDFLLDLFAEADERVVDDTPDRPPRNYDAAPYAEHDYERAQDDDGASVDVAAVDALLAERVQMKRRRLFDEADAIRDELQRVHGVSVWDRERVWRTGRGGGRNQRQRGPPRSLPACGHDYECGTVWQSIFSRPTPSTRCCLCNYACSMA